MGQKHHGRTGLLLVVVILYLLLAGYYLFKYKPAVQESGKLVNQIAFAEKSIEKLKESIAAKTGKDQTAPKLDDSLNQALPQQKNVDKIIGTLHLLETKTHVVIEKADFASSGQGAMQTQSGSGAGSKGGTSGSPVRSIDVQLSVSGTVDEIRSFLHAIYGESRIYSVVNLSYASPGAGGRTIAQIMIRTYYAAM